MNCEDFTSIVSELAENRPMDATTRVTGLAHATICVECAVHLDDARNVNTGLQIAAKAETEETPARVRESLLAAFAEHHTASPQTLVFARKRSSLRTIGWWSAAAVAVAAVIVLALMLPSLMRVFSPMPANQSAGVKETQPVSIYPTPAKPPQRSEVPEPQKKPVVADNNSPSERSVSKPAGNRSTNHQTLARKTRPAIRNNKSETEAVAGNTGNQYFPLTYLASATQMESGTVVRIQVPRSKLISLGLPMNGERANELVKADLVLGDDGVARAIRLVEE